ncbi:hypothetical protein I3842_07G005400 [Carya illinoinensis]|uniref:Uncharacterized protein n=1 Tax=Carya illinoinensis TaxID=32201 RepID=A0A922EDW8_CARIL|nr:hypothetical protein I3842_07G005400 [Carya illinoinensis]
MVHGSYHSAHHSFGLVDIPLQVVYNCAFGKGKKGIYSYFFDTKASYKRYSISNPAEILGYYST